jgi:hypothetical protein
VVTTIGFLHTAAVHVSTFADLVRALAPDVDDVHLVDETLLADARRRGLDDELQVRIATRLDDLSARGCDVVVCTCSTIGGAAEAAGHDVRVVRVDRPMARAAVAIGGRVAVVAAVESTLAPTRALLLEEARHQEARHEEARHEEALGAGRAVTLVDAPCLAAWAAFERGDLAAYLDEVAAHVEALVRSDAVEVVVLAQASMAAVADRFAGSAVPVLSSPESAVRFALSLPPQAH